MAKQLNAQKADSPRNPFGLTPSPSNLAQNASRTLKRKWGAELIQKYIGNYEKTWFAYASSEIIRENAASGGTITALLSFLLKEGKIDGALVCRSSIVDGKVRPEFSIAENENELMASQGSKYIAVDFNRDALPLIRKHPGKLAVVALPCDTTHLRNACENDTVLKAKIALILTLFCGHNSRPELSDMIARKLSPAGATLVKFHYRQGHWRGSLRAEFDNGEMVVKPFSYFSDYQNLFFFCQQKCHHCHDHTGYDSDIAFGDIWSRRMKAVSVKHNAVITRTQGGTAAFQRAMDSGAITANLEPVEAICEGQARSLPFHYNISAKAKAGKLLGIKIKDNLHERVHLNDFVVAWIALYNEKLSRSSAGQKLISLTPRFIIKFFLLLMKGLESV